MNEKTFIILTKAQDGYYEMVEVPVSGIKKIVDLKEYGSRLYLIPMDDGIQPFWMYWKRWMK